MNPISDEEITKAIQKGLGMLQVQRLQQELVEGMRTGSLAGMSRSAACLGDSRMPRK